MRGEYEKSDVISGGEIGEVSRGKEGCVSREKVG